MRHDKASKEKTGPVKRNVLFAEVSGIVNPAFIHHENVVNEYKDQVLLPHMFSRSGPFMSYGDVNKDGESDFYVGGAAGQPGSLYVQKGGRLSRQSVAAFEKDKAYEDMSSSMFDADGDGDIDLYLVSGGSEFSLGSPLYQDRLYLNDGKGGFSRSELPKTRSSGSCVVTYDIDGDGDLDVFRGGQVVAGNYPQPADSYVFVNESGKYVDKTKEIASVVPTIGMV